MKRTPFIRRRTRLKNASDKRKARNVEAREARREFAERCGACDKCGSRDMTRLLAHEIPRANMRQAENISRRID